MNRLLSITTSLCWSLLAGATASLAAQDSLVAPAVLSVDVYAEGTWSSNAASKWALAGAAFGGDISAPVRSLTALTHWKEGGLAGGNTRAGLSLVLPAMNVFEAPEKGRWRTVVALETAQWANAEWSPAAATLAFGRHGTGDDGSLADTRYSLRSATMLRIGGIRSHPGTLRGVPVEWEVEWGIRMGEMHRIVAGGLNRQSNYRWDDEVAAASLDGMQLRSLTAGSAVGLDLAIGLSETQGGYGRPDRWFASLRNLGRGGQWVTEVTTVDTSFYTEGWSLLTGESPDFSGLASDRDTVTTGFATNLPHTWAFRWERDALRQPGITWILAAERLSIAPRWECALTRRSGRGALQTEVGLAWGGWGGTFIPLNFHLPSRAVRQGRPGGTLAIRTRWLALAGTGGRMGLGLHWHRSF